MKKLLLILCLFLGFFVQAQQQKIYSIQLCHVENEDKTLRDTNIIVVFCGSALSIFSRDGVEQHSTKISVGIDQAEYALYQRFTDGEFILIFSKSAINTETSDLVVSIQRNKDERPFKFKI